MYDIDKQYWLRNVGLKVPFLISRLSELLFNVFHNNVVLSWHWCFITDITSMASNLMVSIIFHGRLESHPRHV